MARPKKILVIDDEVDLTDMIKYQLTAHGYKVVVAHNGEEGLGKLTLNTPDLIILDMNMPKMGGLEFLNRITTPFGRPKFPVLVLTARANFEKIFQGIDIVGFMPKPFDIAELIAEVRRLTTGESKQLVYILDQEKRMHVRQIKEILEKEQYEAVVVNELKSLQKKSDDKKPDFILMEYVQEGTNAEDLIRKIKENPFFNEVPIVVYHSPIFEEYQERVLKAGANRYLGQPKNDKTFIEAIKELELNWKNSSVGK